MIVEFTPDVHWISECIETGDRHLHASVYLIRDDDASILVDSGTFHHREPIKEQIQTIVGSGGLDAIVLSHTDYPHSANVADFRAEWGDVDLVASCGYLEIQGLPEGTIQSEVGERMTINGRTLNFVDPPLADRFHTTWIYDYASRVLFTADGFGNYHRPGECDSVFDRDAVDRSRDDITSFHHEMLPWLRFVEPPAMEQAVREALDGYAIDFIGPIHGNPITDVEHYLDVLASSVQEIARV